MARLPPPTPPPPPATRNPWRCSSCWTSPADIDGSPTWAVCYFFALMCTHLCAFRTTSNVRKAALGHLMLLPLGWFSTHPSGEMRHIIDGAVEDTHAVMAHRLPDMSAALMTPIAFVVVSFVFDWRMGVACLIPVVLSMLFITIMLTTGAGADFMGRYNAALDRMSKSAVEYVRGIPVVKTFQQTVYSFGQVTVGRARVSSLPAPFGSPMFNTPTPIRPTRRWTSTVSISPSVRSRRSPVSTGPAKPRSRGACRDWTNGAAAN
ncbi:ABC transporter transmembrane domain-containing protein [Bifidobacterium mongoliense]|uniref:ABC transporter transmembrane domain-containing protein n=1 Tax=Bifidobacterium mongoliense TaxID=518643 RepID=UPI002351E696|nr:ABC transporter transmembrane domain-containing protein [Bifidobacterium mongoliense]